MSIRHKSLRWFVTAVAFCLLSTVGVFADDAPDRTHFGHNITVGPNEEVSDVTCFGCSIRVLGHVDGDVTTFGGSIILEDQAQVTGDATVFAGGIRLDKNAKVDGDVSAFGGRVMRDPEATVQGDITNFSSPGWLLLIFVLPLMLFGGIVGLVVWLVWRVVRRPSVPQPA